MNLFLEAKKLFLSGALSLCIGLILLFFTEGFIGIMLSVIGAATIFGGLLTVLKLFLINKTNEKTAQIIIGIIIWCILLIPLALSLIHI